VLDDEEEVCTQSGCTVCQDLEKVEQRKERKEATYAQKHLCGKGKREWRKKVTKTIWACE
jgi:hypothetical protein